MEGLVFVGAGGLLLGMALCVAICGNPLRAALALIVALVAMAALFVLLDAPFVAAMQALVYAGAIMVLFLFVIMLLNLGPDAMRRPSYLAVSKLLGGVAAAAVAARVVVASLPLPTPLARPLDGSVRHIGTLLLTGDALAFEAISVLLLVAVLGAVVLGLRKLT